MACNAELAVARAAVLAAQSQVPQIRRMISSFEKINRFLRSHTNAAGVEDAEISDSMSIKGKTSQQWGHRHHLHRRHDPHAVCQKALTAERGKLAGVRAVIWALRASLNLQKNLNHHLTKLRALR